jgi:hypothetical protein
MFGEFLLIHSAKISTALFLDKIIYLAITIAIANYLHLAFVYPKPFKFMQSRRYMLAFIYLPAAFFIAFLPSDYFIADMQPEYWGWGKKEGPLYIFFRYYLAIYPLLCISLFAIKRSHADAKTKNGILLFTISCLLPGIVTLIVTVILQPMGINKFNIIVHSFSITPAL